MILGVDPDTHGAAVLVQATPEGPKIVALRTLPIRRTHSKSGKKGAASAVVCERTFPETLKAMFLNVSAATRVDAAVETPLRHFGRSAGPSGFALNHQSYGVVLACAAVMCDATAEVAANTWKSHFDMAGRSKDDQKAKSLKIAAARFPDFAGVFKLRKNHGIADAALIALYALENREHVFNRG